MRYGSLSLEQLTPWAYLNDVSLYGIKITPNVLDKDGKHKGGGLTATADHDPGEVVLVVPTDVILSSARIDDCARSDRRLREVLDAVGPSFTQSLRKKIMLFLLMQLTYSSPDFRSQGIGVSSPFTDYVKILPKKIPLPTFYDDREQELLAGTSLSDMLSLKVGALEQEFDRLRRLTESIPWCQQHWWDEDDGLLGLEDWKLADALYRSRSVGLPHDTGIAMVPILDMANHAAEGQWNARFDVDRDGNVLLVAHDTKHIKTGDEITIMYSHAGACEILFSYGFIEDDMEDARELFLGMELATDDPLAMAKAHFSQATPGIRVYYDDLGSIRWESPNVWWNCINEEDGLDFSVAQTVDGGRELQASWKDAKLGPSDQLATLLMQDTNRDVFLLRATVLVLQRLELQGQILSRNEDRVDSTVHPSGDTVNLDLIRRLRELEMVTLGVAYQQLDTTRAQLLGSDSVRTFLSQQQPDHSDDVQEHEDFS